MEYPLFFFIFGCTEPPIEAPIEVHALSSFLFHHFSSEDEQILENGVSNMYNWLNQEDNFAQMKEGFSIQPLSDEARYHISFEERPIEGTMIGISLVEDVSYSTSLIAEGLFVEDWSEISDTYLEYERTFSRDPICLLQRSCTGLEYEVFSTSSWLNGLLTGVSNIQGQVRWLETELGWVLMQRFWLQSPIDVSPDLGFAIYQQYYLHLSIPSGEDVIRIQMMWMDGNYKEGLFDQDWGISQTLSSIQKENAALISWLEQRNND